MRSIFFLHVYYKMTRYISKTTQQTNKQKNKQANKKQNKTKQKTKNKKHANVYLYSLSTDIVQNNRDH